LYGDPQQLPPVGRRPKKPEPRPTTRVGTPTTLSQNLTQVLQKGLSTGLYQGMIAASPTNSAQPAVALTRPPSPIQASLSGKTVRHVGLLSGESIRHTFSHEAGLVPEPPEQGRMLVVTNLRVMAFAQREGVRETVLIPVEEVKAVSVIAGQRSKGTLFQGGLMIVAAVFFYVLLAYWLTGRIDGPTVPIIRMDLVAFVVFLAILTGVAMMAQIYFAKPDGEVTFQGDGVKVNFQFRGDSAEEEIYVLVNAAFAARQTVVGDTDASLTGQGSD
jgi:hypothetical protein